MHPRNLLLAVAAGVMTVGLTLGPVQAQAPMALTGQVSSAADGPMEGVVVSAKREGSTATISVVSDSTGKFGFPASRLAPGRYSLAIRAVGYDLDGPKSADVAAAGATTADIKLRPTKNLAKQLTNAEWLASFPGTDTQKKALLNCISCHNLDRIVNSNHDAAEFVQVFDRMTGYYPGSTPQHPQRLLGEARRNLGQAAGVKAMAEYLASVNLSRDEVWDYQLKTLPRPTGRATRVVITEYDLPRKQIQPHDAIVDADGMVWFTHFGEQFLGKLDPKTGQVSEYPLPVIKPGFPIGTLDLETDKAGNLWIAMMYQGGVAKFDKATQKFQTWKVPDQWQTDATQQAFLTPTYSDVDGKVWVKNSDRAQILRLDPVTGQWRVTAPSLPMAYQPITTTISICSISPPPISASSTPRPASSPSIARRFRTRVRVAAGSMSRTVSGSPNMPAMPSACSIPRPRRSRNGSCRRRGGSPTTWSRTRTAKPGPARCSAIGYRGSIPGPASSWNICCRRRPISAACLWIIRPAR